MAGLGRKKPFLIPATLLSFVLLILAVVTQRHTCYSSTTIFGAYAPIDGDCEDICNQNGFAALKVIQYAQGRNQAANIPKQYMSCPWENSTGDIFLAAACLMCLWSMLELLLAAKRKFYVFFNIMDIFVLALGSIAAGYMLNDIQQDQGNCGNIEQINVTNNNVPFLYCVRNIYIVSFILLIVTLALWLFQLIYNIVRRKVQNEAKHEEAGYASVPAHQSVPTDPHAVPAHTAGEAGTSANRLP